MIPPSVAELQAYSLGRCEPARAAEIEAFLEGNGDRHTVLEATPEDALVRHLRGAGPLPALPDTTGTPGPETLMPDLPPALLDHPRYRLIRKLGQGGMGTVYLAEHRLMRRLVAVKMIRPRRLEDPRAVERFRQEVQAAARLAHPHLVAAHDAEEVAGLHFLVMEYVEGVSLDRWLAEHGPLPAHETCAYVRQAALGLQHAHEQGLVHRDIKPSNLMRTTDGTVKVLDFGLARLPRPLLSPAGALTAEAAVVGTADYIAPEQARASSQTDIRADIYSLGCTLYQLLSGRPPFPEGSVIDKVLKHATEAPEPLGRVAPGPLPAALIQVVEKMMAKAPDQRYQTPRDAAQVLAPFVVEPERDQARRPDRKRRASRWLLGAALGLVLVGLVWWGLGRNSRPGSDGTPAPREETLPARFRNDLGMEFVLVGKGTAWLGGGFGKPGENRVEVPHDFYLGVYEVTQEQWQKIMGSNPSWTARTGSGKQAVKSIAADDLKRFPVEDVSWNDTQLFLVGLNERCPKPGWIYRLPKEAEWEYACRGGPLAGRFESAFDFFFDSPAKELLPEQARILNGQSPTPTCKVGSFAPNRLGLHDLHGNVREWCDDAVADPKDPKGPLRRAIRGGSWNTNDFNCRAASRSSHPQADSEWDCGLRVALVRP